MRGCREGKDLWGGAPSQLAASVHCQAQARVHAVAAPDEVVQNKSRRMLVSQWQVASWLMHFAPPPPVAMDVPVAGKGSRLLQPAVNRTRQEKVSGQALHLISDDARHRAHTTSTPPSCNFLVGQG
jgi:hypothetical protein